MLSSFRPALWPTLITIPAILVLLGLGTWQVDRRAWKLDVIERIDTRMAAAPVALPAAGVAVDDWEYRRVTVSGALLHERSFYIVANSGVGRPGWHVVTPLARADGAGHVLVNRGFVAQELKEPATRAAGNPSGPVTVTGVVRKPWQQGWFVPDNDPVKNVWFYADAAAMWRHAGLTGPLLLVEADATPNPGDWPRGGQTRVSVPNNHLEYAVTWYSFALLLLIIYFVWHRKQGRL